MAEHNDFSILGVLHLPPLPGSPRCASSFSEVRDHALRDAEALFEGGIRGCIIENFGDAPFRSASVNPHVPAMLAVIGAEITRRWGADLQVGINVLRNDGRAAIAAAAACAAQFVRINVLSGAAWTDQGLIQGAADAVLRYRKELNNDVRIMADVCVKHAVPAGEQDIVRVAIETVERGGADGVIVTGDGTGLPTRVGDVQSVREAVPGHELWIGSGVTPETIAQFQACADGVIVGTYLHRDGAIHAPIDKDRVRSIVESARS